MTTLDFFLQRLDRAMTEEMTVKLDNGVYGGEYSRAIVEHDERSYTIDIVENTIAKCSCQDYTYRCQKLDKMGACKHMIRASIELNLDL